MIRPFGKLVAWLGTLGLLYLLMALLAGCTCRYELVPSRAEAPTAPVRTFERTCVYGLDAMFEPVRP